MGLTLVLVRHGETDWSAEQRYCGRTDVPLNETGRGQARSLHRLAEEAFDSIWTSPLARCRETAELIGVDATIAESIQEFDFGEIDGKRWGDLDGETQAALIDFDGFAAPGGETVPDFASRIDRFVEGLDPGRHLLVTHGGVIRRFLRRAMRDENVPSGTSLEIDIS